MNQEIHNLIVFCLTKKQPPSFNKQFDCQLDELITYLNSEKFPRESMESTLDAFFTKLKQELNKAGKDYRSYFHQISASHFLKRLFFRGNEMDWRTPFIRYLLEQDYKPVMDYLETVILPHGASTHSWNGGCEDLENRTGYAENNNSLHNLILKLPREDLHYPSRLCTPENLMQQAFGNTPLNLACKTGNSMTALQLLAHYQRLHLSINIADEKGMTPLHWACFFRDNELISALLTAGADPTLRNKSGKSPLEIYQREIPIDLVVNGQSSYRQLFGIPQIAEGLNSFQSSEECPHYAIDILFHMDKIAAHQLGVSPHQLAQELQQCKYAGHRINDAFQIFTFYHFDAFIRSRNQKLLNSDILHQLSQATCSQQTGREICGQERPVVGIPTPSSLSHLGLFRTHSTNTTFPKSYSKIWDKSNDLLQKMKALLNDYTKHYSRTHRMLTGHWNRHHIKIVNKIVHKSQTPEAILTELIKLQKQQGFNPNGSLARRIAFIQAKCVSQSGTPEHPIPPFTDDPQRSANQ